jgi:GNAT superfamily N-acetyltransferase
MTTIRELAVYDLGRIGEIDRSEHITQQYKSRGGALDLVEVEIRAPRWGDPGGHAVEHYIESWKPLLDAGGVSLGAFDGDRLVGFAIYQPFLSEGVANLAVLHVTRTHRRKGIAGALTKKLVQLARADGARRLYVSATPTRATVDFYMKQGFEPLAAPNERLFALEPDDIHMELRL